MGMSARIQKPGELDLIRRSVFIGLALASFCFLSGCRSIPASKSIPAPGKTGEEAAPPPESKFVKLTFPVSSESKSFPGWRTRSPGRPILLLHAINGLSPKLLHFALELERWGYRVYLPSLYGDPIGKDPAYGFDKDLSMIKFLRQDGRWNPVALDTVGQIEGDIAAIARWVSRVEGGRRIAVIGNSLTGAIPLKLLQEPRVGLAVLGQPATPVPRIHGVMLRLPRPRAALESLSLTGEEWSGVTHALRRDSRKRIVGFHYVEDPLASIGRFEVLHEKLSHVGLAGRFSAYIMGPSGDSFSDEHRWVTSGETAEKKSMLTPHSTFIDPENESDRQWFRKRLRETLQRGW